MLPLGNHSYPTFNPCSLGGVKQFLEFAHDPNQVHYPSTEKFQKGVLSLHWVTELVFPWKDRLPENKKSRFEKGTESRWHYLRPCIQLYPASNRPLDILVMEPIYIPFLKKLLKPGWVQFLSLATAITTYTVILHLSQTHVQNTPYSPEGPHCFLPPSTSLLIVLKFAIIVFLSCVV